MKAVNAALRNLLVKVPNQCAMAPALLITIAGNLLMVTVFASLNRCVTKTLRADVVETVAQAWFAVHRLAAQSANAYRRIKQ